MCGIFHVIQSPKYLLRWQNNKEYLFQSFMRRLETLPILQKTGKSLWFTECHFSVLQTIEPFPHNPYFVELFVCWFTRTMFGACLIWYLLSCLCPCSQTAVSMQTLPDLRGGLCKLREEACCLVCCKSTGQGLLWCRRMSADMKLYVLSRMEDRQMQKPKGCVSG